MSEECTWMHLHARTFEVDVMADSPSHTPG